MGEPCIIDSGYLPPSKETYNGELNYFYQRTGKAEEIWQYRFFERYKGDFFQDSLHGYGTYTWLQDQEKSFLVEGSLYANCFNGYCTITDSDQTYFEGLVRRNKRYGPGVVTYPDGSQDVGLWNGPYLIRLCYTVFPEHLPRLARTPLGKAKLLRYRKLVPVCEDTPDVATEILKKLGASEEIMKISNQLYNPYIRNVHSLLFDKKLHDAKIYGETPDCSIDVPVSTTDFFGTLVKKKPSINDDQNAVEVIDYLVENVDTLTEVPTESRASFLQSKIMEEKAELIAKMHSQLIDDLLGIFLKEVGGLLKLPKRERNLIFVKRDLMKKLPDSWSWPDVPLKKVAVTDILAKNNEEQSIEMLKYIFRNINLEKNVSFKVRKLLIGDRSDFGPPASNENACIQFLQECSAGNYGIAAELLVRQKLNPDVCDARGNSAVMFSAAKDKWRVIKMLSNFGANLDRLNDDGLSPLCMSILRYIAFNEDVTDWEQAFLNDVPTTKEEKNKGKNKGKNKEKKEEKNEEKKEEKNEVQQWRPRSSLVELKALSMTTNLEAMITEEDAAIKNNLLQKESLLDDCHIDLNDRNLKLILGEYYDEIRDMKVDMEYKDFQQKYEIVADPKQKYLFRAELVIPPHKKARPKSGKKPKKGKAKKQSKSPKSKGSKKSKSTKSTASSEKLKKPKPEPEPDPKEIMKKGVLKVILTTIKVLLELGCDPNYCSVPIPALLMAIYSKSKELTELLLQSGANPDVASIPDGLTPLVLLATLPFSSANAELFESLLKKGANPNKKVNPGHWEEEKTKLRGKYTPEKDLDKGKTVMHVLAMRYDYDEDLDDNQSKMIKALLDHGANPKEIYLGHTPFSIAILRGNIKLIKFYIESKSVDPYATLGESMGTPITILILKRYNNVLPVEKSKEVYDTLTGYNINPLVEIPNNGNAIQFMEEEYEVKPKDDGKGKKAKGKKGKKSKKSSKSSKKSKKGKKNPVEELKEYLIIKSREMLERNVLSRAFNYIRTFILLSTDPTSEIFQTLIKFFNMKNVGKLLQVLIDRGLLQYNKGNVFVTYQLLNLMDKYLKKKEKKLKIGDIFNALTWKFVPIDRIPELVEPEIDTKEDIYEVCFYCCKKLNKTLIICPTCGLVYFCSQECNKLSNRSDTVHKCKNLFYDKEKKRMDNCLKLGIPYEEANKLRDALKLANDVLFKTLKKRFGASVASNLLEAATIGGIVDVDLLLKNCAFLRNSVEDKLGMTGKNVEELLEQFTDAMEGIQDEDFKKKKKKGKKSDRDSKQSKSKVTIDDDKAGGKKTKAGKKKKGGSKSEGDEKSGGETSEDEEKKSGKRGKKKGKKTSESDSSESEKVGAKRKKSGKKKTGGKGKESSEGTKTTKGSGRTKTKGSTKTKGGAKTKGDTKVKSGGTKKEKGVSIGKDKKGGMKKKETSSKTKPSGYKTDRSTKASLEKKLSPSSPISPRLEVKTAADQMVAKLASYKFDDDLQPQDQQPPQPLSCMQYVGKKELDTKTLPAKCQFLLEELARLFPDFDFFKLMWPFVLYCDGQLYYRFLDKSPLFLETLSNI